MSKKKFELLELSKETDEYIKKVYEWYKDEEHMEYYTCRPTNAKKKSFEEYREGIFKALDLKGKIFILTLEGKALGKIMLFDYNSRNRSAEFGYYFPEENRGVGYGRAGVEAFLEKVFEDEGMRLNKVYATTASGNYASIKLLERLGFSLDGRLREHYWIGEKREDQLNYSLLKIEWEKRG